MGIVFSMVTLMAAIVGAANGGQPNSTQLLEWYEGSHSVLSHSAYDTLTLYSHTDSIDDVSRWRREQAEVRLDGERFDIAKRLWKRLPSRDTPVDPSDAAVRRHIWDGDTWYDHDIAEEVERSRIRISYEDTNSNEHWSVGSVDAPLQGIFRGDLRPLASVLRQARSVTVRTRNGGDAGGPFYELSAETPNGQYEIVLDAGHDYGVRHARVTKAGADLLYGKDMSVPVPDIAAMGLTLPPGMPSPPSGRRTRFEFVLDNVQFEKVGDRWVPVAADWSTTTTYESGRVVTQTTHHERSNINLSPDFAAMNAFVPDVRNGTRASVIEQQSVVPLYWEDGDLVPHVDEDALAFIDREVERIVLEQAAEPARSAHPAATSSSRPAAAPSRAGSPTAAVTTKRSGRLYLGIGVVCLAVFLLVAWRFRRPLRAD